MKKLLLILLGLCALGSPLHAQTAKTRAALYTEIDTELATNATGGITAADLRGIFKNVVASAAVSLTDGTGVVTTGSYANPAWLTALSWSKITGTPTTLSGYGITGVPLLAAANTFTVEQSAPALLLTGTGSVPTISPSQNGLGWADNRLTLQTPVGAFQFYQTGSPLESVVYWPGRFIAAKIEAATITGNVAAASLTGAIPSATMLPSAVPPFDKWQIGQIYAGTAGLPYVVDTNSVNDGVTTEPTIGVYYPQINVTDGTTVSINQFAGRYRTAAQMRTDLAVANLVAAPATAAATGTAGQIAYDASFFYVCTATNTWVRAALTTW